MKYVSSGGGGEGGGGSGDVAGPASSTDNALARYDSTTGKLLQDGVVTESDAGAVSGVTQLDVDNLRVDGNTISSTNANGKITLDPNGSGTIDISSANVENASNVKDSASTYWLRSNADLRFSSAMVISWSLGNVDSGGDWGLARLVAGVGKVTDGSSGLGWLQRAGQSYLAADATNATATLATTGLSVTVKSGRKYAFKCVLYVSDSVAAEGAQIDFGGGTATATNFRAHVTGFDTALTVNTQLSSLTGVASAGTFTGSGMMEIHGSFEPSANGTFIPRFAQNTHAAGTLTLFRGSHLLMWDLP